MALEILEHRIPRANSEPKLGSDSVDTGIGSAGSASRKSSLSSTRSSSPSTSTANVNFFNTPSLAEKIQVRNKVVIFVLLDSSYQECTCIHSG